MHAHESGSLNPIDELTGADQEVARVLGSLQPPLATARFDLAAIEFGRRKGRRECRWQRRAFIGMTLCLMISIGTQVNSMLRQTQSHDEAMMASQPSPHIGPSSFLSHHTPLFAAQFSDSETIAPIGPVPAHRIDRAGDVRRPAGESIGVSALRLMLLAGRIAN